MSIDTSAPVLNVPVTEWEKTPPVIQRALIDLCNKLDEVLAENRLLRAHAYGKGKSERLGQAGDNPKSKPGADPEKSSSPQGDSCDKKQEQPASDPASPGGQPAEPSTQSPSKAGRQRGCRKPLPSELPRVERFVPVVGAERQCCGKERRCIGHEKSERILFRVASVEVEVTIREKLACDICEGVDSAEPVPEGPAPDGPVLTASTLLEASVATESQATNTRTDSPESGIPVPPPVRRRTVVVAPAPRELIPKGIASASLLAHIITAKFVDGLPLYRQQKQFDRLGIHLSRSTMCRWLFMVAAACAGLMRVLRKEVLAASVIGVDETTVQVLREPNRSATTDSYMWVYRGGTRDGPAVEFVYTETRAGDQPKQYLRGFKGAVQSDGYPGYDFLDNEPDVEHLGCNAHARRGFVDVLKGQGKGWKKLRGGISAEVVLAYRELYALEREADRNLFSDEERYRLRQEQAKPRMRELRIFLVNAESKVPPESKLGKAISYTLNQWPRLERYLNSGSYRIDNNWVENAIRPFAVGRKNWLFCCSPKGASASATFYSLIETAKANGLEPYWYLNAIFERLPYAKTEEDYKALLPQYIDRSLLIPRRT
jgi:transposase